MLAYNDSLIVTRVTPNEEPFFHTYTYITVSELANTLTFEYLSKDIPVEKINEKTMQLLNYRLRGSNKVKNWIKESELPQIQKLIDSTKKRIEEIESSSQESTVRIKHLRKEIDRRNEYIRKLDKYLKDKDFVFLLSYDMRRGRLFPCATGCTTVGYSKDGLRDAIMQHYFERKIIGPPFNYNKWLIEIIAQHAWIKNYYRDHIIPDTKVYIESCKKEIAALEAELQRGSAGRIERKPPIDAPPPKSVFNGRWRIYYQGWYVLEIQEGHDEVSGEIWYENDTKRGDGSLSGKRLDNLVIGRAPPQDGIKGEFEMVKEIQKYDREEKKYYPALVQHDFKSFKFRIEGGNKLRGELCFRAKGDGKSLCRSVNGERVE
jgi:hypothetical protein